MLSRVVKGADRGDVIAVGGAITRYGQTLTDLASGVGAQSDLRRADFARMSAGLSADRLPGAGGVAFVVPVATDQVAADQARWRAADASGLLPSPGPGDRHSFVVFDKVLDSGASVAGLDLERSPDTAADLRTAQSSATWAISATPVLLPDRLLSAGSRQNAVLLAAPVYRGDGEAQLRESQDQLRRMAFHDTLTGHANRALSYDRVGQTLLGPARTGGLFAVYIIDLDGFKHVNDHHGHAAGDAVLREAATRLTHGLRATDTVARFDGDEFAILARPVGSRHTEQRIVANRQQPIDVGVAVVTASIGIAVNRPGNRRRRPPPRGRHGHGTAKTSGQKPLRPRRRIRRLITQTAQQTA